MEIDEKQDRMVQYLKKAYNCRIDVIDKHDYNAIILEMLYSDVFIGSKHIELAKLLRKPFLNDDPDPIFLSKNIEKVIGKLQEQQNVCSEDAYLQEFLAINGYDMHAEPDNSIDSKIDQFVLELSIWFNGGMVGVSELMPSEKDHSASKQSVDSPENFETGNLESSSWEISSSFKKEVEKFLDENGVVKKDEILYEKTVNDEQVLYKKRSGRKSSNRVLLLENQGNKVTVQKI